MKKTLTAMLIVTMLLALVALGGAAESLPAGGNNNAVSDPAEPILKALMEGQVFQKGSDTIGAGYGEIIYFVEDGSYFWFASQYEDDSSYFWFARRYESEEIYKEEIYEGAEECRFRAGTWQLEEAGCHEGMNPGGGMDIALTTEIADWIIDGKAARIISQQTPDYHEIHIQDGTIYIGGFPFYPVGTALTADPAMLPWLWDYVKDDPYPYEYVLGIDDMADLAAATSPANGQPLGGPEGVGGATSPLPVRPGGTLVSGLAAVDVLPWSYFTGVMAYDGDHFVVLARDTPRGEMELLFSATRDLGDAPFYSVAYVQGSYEQSGKTGLYFTLDAPNGLHWLYRFDLAAERTSLVQDGICSELVLFDKPQADIAGLGWVLFENMILPIRLNDGSVCEAMAQTLEDLGAAPDLSNHFWAGIGGGNDTKFPILSALDNGVLEIEVVEFNSQASSPESKMRFQYDCNSVFGQ